MKLLDRFRQAVRSPLARRIIIATILFSSAITLVLTAFQLYAEYRYEVDGLEKNLRQAEKVHLKSLTQSLWATNVKELTLQLEGLTQAPNLEYAAVYEGERLWAQAGERVSTRVIERHYPMVYVRDGRRREIGTLRVAASLDNVYEHILTRAVVILSSNALKTFLVAGFIFVLFHQLVNRHLQSISEYVRRLEHAGAGPPLRLARTAGSVPDEFDALTSAINLMQERTHATLTFLYESEERLKIATESSNTGLWDWDLATNRVYRSPVFKRQLGYRDDEMEFGYEEWESHLHPDDSARVQTAVADYLAGRLPEYDVEFRLRHKDGSYRWILSRGALLRDGSGKPVRMLGAHIDITERVRAEAQLSYLAHYDDLTGLPNRVLFHDRLQQAMSDAERHHRLVAVVFVDLDRFKNVNDTLGHEAGDQLLKGVTDRLLGAVRRGDTVARLSGDEFTVVLADMAHVDDAARVAQKILEVFAQPFHVAGRDLFMGASLGITVFPLDTRDAGELLRNADIAMYQAKDAGRNSYRFYAAEMTAKANENLQLENDLRRAIERQELVVHYQPIVTCSDGQIVGMEALLRWQHGTRGLIMPNQFIPLAEDTGLIAPIGEWVLREACTRCRHWQQQTGRPLRVAVNLSARQFHHHPILRVVRQALDDSGLKPDSLELEITESLLLRDDPEVDKSLHDLAGMGVALTIDDFGTGYSSLSYLRRFPVDALKIDQSFTHNIPADAGASALARAILNMARSLELKTTAEGIETAAQLNFYRAHGCDLAQGYYFSKPVAAHEFTALLAAEQLPIAG